MNCFLGGGGHGKGGIRNGIGWDGHGILIVTAVAGWLGLGTCGLRRRWPGGIITNKTWREKKQLLLSPGS